MKRFKTFLIIGIIFLVVSIAFTFFLKTNIDSFSYHADQLTEDGVIEESCCGSWDISCHHCPEDWANNKVSFSTLNFAVLSVFPPSFLLYKLTNYIGYLPIAFAGIYAIFGVAQLIKRKSLKKIDKGLFALAGLFVIALATYFIFEKLAINYRPVVIDGELEASFPSSHTMLILCVSFGILLFNRVYYSEKKYLKYFNAFIAFLAAFIVVGRFLSGVHWATDIIGGLLFATSFILIYYAVLLKTSHKHDKIDKTK